MKQIFLWLIVVIGSLGFADSIIVEDPSVIHYAELPSRDVHLKTFRASDTLIRTYSAQEGVENGDSKDNPKAPNCTRAEIDVLKRWTTNDIYRRVNQALRTIKKGMVDGVKLEEKWENTILLLASAVNCAPQYEGEVVRIEHPPKAVLNEYQPDNFLLMKGFTSTTKGKKHAESLPLTEASKIFIERASGADVDSLGVSPWSTEKEVLIRPGTVFKVLYRKEMENPLKIKWEFGFAQY